MLHYGDDQSGVLLEHLSREVDIADGVSPRRHEHRGDVVNRHIDERVEMAERLGESRTLNIKTEPCRWQSIIPALQYSSQLLTCR